MASIGRPKGILKNKNPSNGAYAQESNLDYGGFGGSGTGSGRSWDSVVSGSSSSDMTSSLLNIDSVGGPGSDRSLRPKLLEFVSRKGDMLFRPLGTDEIPISDRGNQPNTKDHFGIVPSMDFFLRVENSERRSHFFHSAQPGEIVLGELNSKTVSGLYFQLLCLEGGRSLYLEDLGLNAYCPISQMIPAIDPNNPNRIFSPGDLVRLEILSVKPELEKIVVGMKGNALTLEMKHSAQLGLVFEQDFPLPYKTAAFERKSKVTKTYEELLDECLGFHNPNSVTCLASAMGILNNRNTLMTGLRGVFPENEKGTTLRRVQNGRWAHGSVAEGIRHFKSGNLTEAFQCLNKALSIDGENVEGLVARGALFANKGGFEKAIEDFESALRHNPNHFNAKKYLGETLVALARQQEESGKIEEAIGTYGKCLVVRPDHPDAKDALWSLYSRTEKTDLSKLNPLSRARTLDLREKLKALLQSEIQPTEKHSHKSEEELSTKKKKKKKESSSDSDTDSSDSSDSEEEKKGRKKKKKRKKSKKSGKKVVKKEESLSPFSKRLAQGGKFAGVVEFKDANWGRTTTVTPVIPQETKKKKKEKRKRKKKTSDSSSSSSSSSSSDSEVQVKAKGKKKSNLSDLGDLEAKLSAYFSKVEQEKIAETLVPSVSAPTPVLPMKQEVTMLKMDTKSKILGKKEKSPVVTRIGGFPKDLMENRIHESRYDSIGDGGGGKHSSSSRGKIELRTDDFGNFLMPGAESIVRTVVNVTEEAKPKFEMKIRSQSNLVPTMEGGVLEDKGELGSKWRKVGEPNTGVTYTVTRLEQAPKGSKLKPTKDKPPMPSNETPKGNLYVPPSSRPVVTSIPFPQKEEERNYRTRKTSRSRSRTRSRSRSKSPIRIYPKVWGRGGRGRPRTRSRYSRSSSDWDSYSRSRSRSRSRSPRRTRDSFRYAREERVDRVRRTFVGPVPNRRRGRGFPASRMRNIFPRSRSKSRERGRRSRSKSKSKHRDKKSRSKSPRKREIEKRKRSKSKDKDKITKREGKETPKKESKESPKEKEVKIKEDKAAAAVVANTEISIGSLTTKDASDVEVLLDQRKAIKKEEMKERNPEFFRTV